MSWNISIYGHGDNDGVDGENVKKAAQAAFEAMKDVGANGGAVSGNGFTASLPLPAKPAAEPESEGKR